MKKALKIDVVAKTVTKVEIDKYQDIYAQIGNGCNLFCCPVEFENGDTLFADDESLLKEVEGCFILPNWNYPIVGNAIILGTDEEGDSIDCKSTIEEISSEILFGNKEVAEEYQKHVEGSSFVYFEPQE
jgi:hypothetical protein